MKNNLLVKVLNIKSGLQVYDNIKYIRIFSKNYNLLVMKDYLPIIGEINGNVEIIGDESIKLENVKGYYMQKNNEFSLIIKEGL